MRQTIRRLAITAALTVGCMVLGFLAYKAGYIEQVVPYQLMVLLAGYLLPMNWAVGCAVAFPILSMLAFGSPEPVVGVPLAVIQMIAVAAFTNFFYAMLSVDALVTALCSVASGIVLLFCAASIYSAVSRHAVQPMRYVRQFIALTWPGLLLQLTVDPGILWVLRRVSKGSLGARLTD